MAEDVTILPTVRSYSYPCPRPGILKFGKMHCSRQRVWFEEIDPHIEGLFPFLRHEFDFPEELEINHPRDSLLQTILNFLSLEEEVRPEDGYQMDILCCKVSAFVRNWSITEI